MNSKYILLIIITLSSSSCILNNLIDKKINEFECGEYYAVCYYNSIEDKAEICEKKSNQFKGGFSKKVFIINENNTFSYYEKFHFNSDDYFAKDSIWGKIERKGKTFRFKTFKDFFVDTICVYNNGIRKLEIKAINNPVAFSFFGVRIPHFILINEERHYNELVKEKTDSSFMSDRFYLSRPIASNDTLLEILIPFSSMSPFAYELPLISHCKEKLSINVNTSFIVNEAQVPDSAWFDKQNYLNVRFLNEKSGGINIYSYILFKKRK